MAKTFKQLVSRTRTAKTRKLAARRTRELAATLTRKQRAAIKARKVKAEIKRRNKLFQAASPKKKRVLIAKDVIAQIKAKRYVATAGTWAVLRDRHGDDISFPFARTEVPDAAQVQSVFLSMPSTKCECCALGGIMMSCTLYNNNQTLRDFDDDASVGQKVGNNAQFSNGLHRFFSRQQLALIECAFEGGRGGFTVFLDPADPRAPQIHPLLHSVPRSALKRAVGYIEKYPKDDKRMTVIMRNIIKNNGTFKP